MIERSILSYYLHDFLACDDFSDYTPNGLQIEGKEKLQRIASAVTASMDVIKQAIRWKADALLVHHGYFWRGEDPRITGMKRQRIEQLLKHGINLFAYHLPLDCHLQLGNNACIVGLLELDMVKTYKAGNTDHLLWKGILPEEISGKDLGLRLEKTFKQKPIHVSTHDRKIRHIAWCTGAAQDFIVDSSRLAVDAYISGEISERTYYQAKELGIDYYSCGHHATERFGIQALGQHLAERFGLETRFFDSDNPC